MQTIKHDIRALGDFQHARCQVLHVSRVSTRPLQLRPVWQLSPVLLYSMLDAALLVDLHVAALAKEWFAAGEAFIDLRLIEGTAADALYLDAMVPPFRLRDGEAVAALIDGIGRILRR